MTQLFLLLFGDVCEAAQNPITEQRLHLGVSP